MSQEITPNPISTSGVVLDSLSANEFAVEIDGTRATGIFRIIGFKSFKLDVRPALTKYVQEPFTLTKMVQRDPQLPFNQWVRETVNAKDDINRPKRTLTILALDEGIEIRRWTIKNAWINEINYSDFDTSNNALVEEKLTIQFESIEESWGEA